MGLGSDIGKKAVDEVTDKTIPELLQGLLAAVDRLDGATITITIKLAEKK